MVIVSRSRGGAGTLGARPATSGRSSCRSTRPSRSSPPKGSSGSKRDARTPPKGAKSSSGPPAAGSELGQVGLDLGLGLVVPEVEVVDDQEVDPRHPEPLQAVLVRPHDAIVAVVEDVVERQAAGPEARVEGLRVAGGLEDAADLGRENEVAPRPAVEEAAHPVLRLAPAVPWCRVVVAEARVPGGAEGGRGLLF